MVGMGGGKSHSSCLEMVALGLLELLLDSRTALCAWSNFFVVTARKLSPVWPQEVGEVSATFLCGLVTVPGLTPPGHIPGVLFLGTLGKSSLGNRHLLIR